MTGLDNKTSLLNDWLRRARESQHAHHYAGKACRRLNTWLGNSAVSLTFISAFLIFSTKWVEYEYLDLIAGGLAFFAAVLSAVQTLGSYFEKALSHETLGAKYGSIRRRIELMITNPTEFPSATKELEDLVRSLDRLGEERPVVPDNVWKATLKTLNLKAASQTKVQITKD